MASCLTDRMTGRAFSPAPAQPSAVVSRAWNEHAATGMNVNTHWTRLRDSHECGLVEGLIMIDAVATRIG
jgi:hypothetical protein